MRLPLPETFSWPSKAAPALRAAVLKITRKSSISFCENFSFAMSLVSVASSSLARWVFSSRTNWTSSQKVTSIAGTGPPFLGVSPDFLPSASRQRAFAVAMSSSIFCCSSRVLQGMPKSPSRACTSTESMVPLPSLSYPSNISWKFSISMSEKPAILRPASTCNALARSARFTKSSKSIALCRVLVTFGTNVGSGAASCTATVMLALGIIACP
mmetsp:Transcript_67288/g.121201  ORF Transcript_67288/g.121201 Transcript_67288/m.121201 type:complete len:213 (+) Transcript_67288:349-987(+)